MKKLYVVSLGCPKNLVDSERAVSIFLNNGYSLSFDVEKSHSVLINTCAFIDCAVRESNLVIREFIKLKKEKKIKELFVLGCFVSRFKDSLIKKYPDVDLFIDLESFDKLEDFLVSKKSDCRFISSRNYFYYPSRFLLTSKHVAYLKISDGCDNFCSYCLIPYIRGRFISRDLNSIIEEAKTLSHIGVKELVIVSQDSLRYGIDIYKEYKIIKLLEKLEDISGIKWIRLMYLYPSLISKELIEHIKKSKKILNYFDIPLQHISDKILKIMNRKYYSKDIRKIFDMIYSELKYPSVRTNFIVGFPYEDEKDFKQIIDFIDYYPINYINIFKYSPQRGTASFNLERPDRKLVQERYKILLNKASAKIDELNKNISNKVFMIIADTNRIGRSYMDAPDIDGHFLLNYDVRPGHFYKVSVINCEGKKRYASVLEEIC